MAMNPTNQPPKSPPFDAQGVALLNAYQLVKERNQGAATRSELTGDAADGLYKLVGDCEGVAQRGRSLLSLLGMPTMRAVGVDPVSHQVLYGQAPVRSNAQIEQGMLAAQQVRARLDDAPARITSIITAALDGCAPDVPDTCDPVTQESIKRDLEKLLEDQPPEMRNVTAQKIVRQAVAENDVTTLAILLGKPCRFILQRLNGVAATTLQRAYIRATVEQGPSGVYSFGGPKAGHFLVLQDDDANNLMAMVQAAVRYFDYRFNMLTSLVEK